VNRLSVRTRFYGALLGWVIYGFFLLGFSDRLRPYMLLFLFGGVAAFGGYVISLRCPNCRKPIGQHPIGFWTPWTPDHCRHCGRPSASHSPLA